jgi:hypothetical protein
MVGGFAAAAFALFKIWREIQWQRASRSLDLLLKLNDQFRSDVMLKERAAAARILQGHRERPVPNGDDAWTDVDDVLDFFQIAATLVREGHASKDVTYNFFAYWFIRYWVAARDRIQFTQARSPISWKNAQWLYDELKLIDEKQNASRYTRDTEKDIDAFLREERRALLPPATPSAA